MFLENHAVLAEWKPPVYDNTSGITLVTATTRRNSPNVRFILIFFSSLELRTLDIQENILADTLKFGNWQNLGSYRASENHLLSFLFTF